MNNNYYTVVVPAIETKYPNYAQWLEAGFSARAIADIIKPTLEHDAEYGFKDEYAIADDIHAVCEAYLEHKYGDEAGMPVVKFSEINA